MNEQSILGIILARAGSQGLPNKHLLPLLGRAVIEYTFDHALDATMLGGVLVTTDCARVRLLAQQRGLPSIDRPPDLATGDASVQDVCLHALRAAERRAQRPYAAAVVLYGNVPVRPPGMIDDCVRLLLATGCDSVRSLSPVGKWHPAWMHRLDGDAMRPLHANNIHRRQDLEPIYLHDGACVAVSRASLLRAADAPTDPHAFFGVDRRGVVGPMDGTVEVDHRRDLFWAEAVLRERAEQCPGRAQQPQREPHRAAS
jgi:CMP-N,N'-diacetyllegionaminic acid synthase